MQHIIEKNSIIVLSELENAKHSIKHFSVHENAHLTYFFLVTDSADITIFIQLLGPKAQATIFCICLLSEEQTVVINTQQKHSSSRTESQVLVKSIMCDAARLTYNGSIIIEKDAHKSVAQQHNKNMLLSSEAYIWANPSLEVLTNDVQCAHGSASGQVSQDQLFYLQSRGLGDDVAKKLLLQGFFADILNNMSDNAKHSILVKKLMKNLRADFPILQKN